MTSSFLRLLSNLWSGQRGRPAETPRAERAGYPATFAPVPPDPRAPRNEVFDPAARHHRHGFRLGEPVFDDADLAQRWRQARRHVMDHLLRVVVESPWRGNLVLRGSLTMSAWFGERAREPGDVDWVVQPHTILISQPLAAQMMEGLVLRVRERPFTGSGGCEILIDDIATDDIWTYERAPGRRIVFPFRCGADAGDLPQGFVQMDFVFGEELPLPPVQTEIPRADGARGTVVFSAGRELSLAWKILWLLSDSYPQGKDLYDAVLLAENTQISRQLLERVLDDPTRDVDAIRWLEPGLPTLTNVDWDNFALEYPQIAGDVEHWKGRLLAALAPVLR
jgi:Nucleotidyl transferase AbiEii toxin, Type IV TA system